MPLVSYSREITVPAAVAHEALDRVLRRLAAQSANDKVTLPASVGPRGESLNIPVALEIGECSGHDETTAVTIGARSAKAFFPHFEGRFWALAMSPARTMLRLKGSYRVPLGAIGATLNAAGLRTFAEEGLVEFFERVVEETTREAHRSRPSHDGGA